ncbi:MAG: histidine phosphatase family protein, partial [Candidatus Marinimicrobia bacterium]|nr:histidine phosphatase family protein [Candidatus Neomarinimicrobiota bacterium]
MKSMNSVKSICIILALGFIGCSSLNRTSNFEDFQCYPESVYLFRHAEKQIIKGEKNPELTRDGFARSDQLAEVLKDVQNGIIYSSEFKRTQQTVNPLANVWNTNVKIHTAHDPEGQI